MSITLSTVRRALSLPDFDGRSAQLAMIPQFRPGERPYSPTTSPRLGSVLALLYCHDDALHVLLTRRREDLNSHAGQISFPGGRRDPGETFLATALRETHEEVGVPPDSLTILGELTRIYILPSDYEVQPFVAWHADGRRPRFRPNAAEVAELLEVPLAHLLDPANCHEEPWQLGSLRMQIRFFEFNGHKVWGATAMMLNEFVERLRLVMGNNELK
ncbi:MAG: CoA pyrophosphatase [Anaerolineales bacterium]|nr:CoA pyrophosphatase [Anaerolineales bacterium]